jgi:ABC-2 type transport system permease protein
MKSYQAYTGFFRTGLSKIRVIFLLSLRIFLLRFRTDKLTVLWAVLEPAIWSFAYWFLITQVSQGALGIEPYYFFVASGILPWLWFSNSINDAQSMFKSHGKLMSSLGISIVLWPIPIVLSRLAEYLFGLSVLVGLLSYFVEYKFSILWLFPAIAVQFILILGMIYLLSPILIVIPDFARIIRVSLRIGFFLTPILYLTVNVPTYLQAWLIFNPLTPLLETYRYALFGVPVSYSNFAGPSLTIGLLLIFGLFVNQALRRITMKALSQ